MKTPPVRSIRLLGLMLGALAPSANAQVWSKLYPPDLGAVRDVEVQSAVNVWVAASNGQLRHSTDGGVTWNDVAVGANSLWAVEFSGSLGLVGGTGLWRSDDSGQTWSLTDAADVRALSLAGSNAVAVGADGHARFSFDGGLSWGDAGALAGAPALDDVQLSASGRAWTCGAGGALFLSTDGGANWTTLAAPTAQDLTAVHFTDASNGWLAAGTSIYRTSDGGATWAAQSQPTGAALSDLHFLTSSRGWACGSDGTVLSTTNGGTTWSAAQAGILGLTAIDFVDFFNGFCGGAQGVVHRSSDGSATWAQVAGGTTVPAPTVFGLDAKEDGHAWVATFEGQILRSTDGGDHWDPVQVGTNYQWRDISFFDATHGYACGERQAFFPSVAYTHDGGLSWIPIAYGLMVDFNDVEALGPDTALVTGDTFVWRTTDGGLSWPSVTPMPFGTYHGMDFLDDHTGWIAGTQISRTDDAGLTWTHQLDPVETMFDVSFVPGSSPGIGWCVGNNASVLRTVDGGATWMASTISGFSGALYSVSAVNSSVVWVAGADGYVARSNDGGITWVAEAPGFVPGAQPQALRFLDAEHGFLSGYLDTGVWRRDAAPCPPPGVYCTSKASSIPGCTPSVAFSGAPQVTNAAPFVVRAEPTPGNNFGLFLYTTQGAAATPLNTAFGALCITTSGMKRVGSQNGGGQLGICNGAFQLDFNALAAGGSDPALVTGARVDTQVWYRDAPNPGGANFSEAGTFTYCP